MRTKAYIIAVLLAVCCTSCKTYQLQHYKVNELDKLGDVSKFTVYVHSKTGTFKVDKPTFTGGILRGSVTPVKDEAEIAEIKNPKTPHEVKKHKHDLNLYTPTEVKDSTISLKKSEINDVSHAVAQPGIKWGAIGMGIATVIGIAFSIALIGGIVYWFAYAAG